MVKKKILLTKKQIELLAEEVNRDMQAKSKEGRIKKEDIENMIGDPEDRRIEYPSPADVEAIKNDMEIPDDKTTSRVDASEMKSPPHELLEYLNKIEEAKSILSKVAAKEDDENIKNRIYSHYDKAQKLAFELIKEFGIVH